MEVLVKNRDLKYLEEISRKGHCKARTLRRANILLLASKGNNETEIAKLLGITRMTVYNIEKRYLAEGLRSALEEKSRSGQPRKYTDKNEAEIIALSCTEPPHGRKGWTVRLIAQNIQESGVKTMNRETVRLILKKRSQAMAEEDVVHTRDR
jgi:putative transposase